MIHLAVTWRHARAAADLLLGRDRRADALTRDGRVVPDPTRDRVAEALARAVLARRRDRVVAATRTNGGVLIAVPEALRATDADARRARRAWIYAHRDELWQSLRSWVGRHGADAVDPRPATEWFVATGYAFTRDRGRGRAPDLGRYLTRWCRWYAKEARRRGLRLDLVRVRLRPDEVPENYRRGRTYEVTRLALRPEGVDR